MKNIMTEYQRELTTNNLHLVKEVIQKRIKINNLPLLAYEDFYAIGCEALCRAAMAYQPSRGEFAPLACRYIYNTLIDHVRHQNYFHSFSASPFIDDDDERTIYDLIGATDDMDDKIYGNSVMDALGKCKAKYSGITLKGVEAIELKLLGHETREIAERYGTTVNNVYAWIARARSRLKDDPEMSKLK